MPYTNPFETVYTPDMCSVDYMGSWQPGAVFRATQEAAGEHCAQMHMSYEALRDEGLAWVLTRAHLKMEDYPRVYQPVTVKTWPGQTRHMFFPRHFVLEVDGRQVGCMSTVFVLMDLETRKIAAPSRLPKALPQYDIPAPLPFPGNVGRSESPVQSLAYRPVYTDIDMNGHVNNTRYVDWFLNRFDHDWHARHRIAELLIHYNHEVHAGEEIALELQTEGECSLFGGRQGDKLCFAMQGLWQAR